MLAKRLGYALVGINRNSVNAFFVRHDLLCENLSVKTGAECYEESLFRESRDQHGEMNFISPPLRIEAIRGLPVLNTETNQLEPL